MANSFADPTAAPLGYHLAGVDRDKSNVSSSLVQAAIGPRFDYDRAMDPNAMRTSMELHHLALGATDLSQSEAFYESVVGLAVQCRHFDDAKRHRATWFHLGERFIALERVASNPQSDVCPLALTIRATERAALQSRMSRAGYAVEKETDFTFYVRDPAGNLIGFSHHPHARFNASGAESLG